MKIVATRERNYGIDILRILSMFFICVLHVINKAGFTGSLPPNGFRWLVVWLIEAFAIGAVNIYAIISGYVGYGSKFKIKKVLKLYFRVAFYSSAITLLFMIIEPGKVSFGDLLKSFLPFIFDFYWYYTVYFCMYFFTPFINKMIKSLNKKETIRLVILIFIFFTIIPTVFTDIYKEHFGYTLIWIALLYILGACMKKASIEKMFKKKYFLLTYFGATILAWLWLVLSKAIVKEPDTRFIQYTSPLITLATFALVAYFANLKFKSKHSKKIISLFAGSAFSVYLIHVHPIIWENGYLYRIVGPTFFLPKIWTVPAIIACAAAIYLACSLIDFIRVKIFNAIIKIWKKNASTQT